MEAEIPIRSAYVAEGAERDDRLRDILKRAATRGTALLEVTRSELDRLTGGALHQGIALQLPAFDYAHPDDLLSTALASDQPPLIVALDSITDPRNLGAIVRSAAAFGAHGVLIPQTPGCRHDRCCVEDLGRRCRSYPDCTATNLNRSLRAYADAGLSLIA
jgi:23S rRNA (guanosine2251-2'-O)-methyltransferase